MSYNIVENGQLKSITSSGMLIEGKPIYGVRKQYATNKVLPKSGESPFTYTIDKDGVLIGSIHKIGTGYSAFLTLNGQGIDNFDNYGTESGTFSFPSIRVNVGDVIGINTNVPATENTNVFILNDIGVIPIIGMEPGGEIEVGIADAIKVLNIKVQNSEYANSMDLTSRVNAAMPEGYQFLTWTHIASNGWITAYPIYCSQPHKITGYPFTSDANLTAMPKGNDESISFFCLVVKK